MFLLILDKNPYRAAELVPDRLKFKQLLELGQLICSAGISDVYKKIYQGKDLQKWIKLNPIWVLSYYSSLLTWCILHIKLKKETFEKFRDIMCDLYNNFKTQEKSEIKTAIFRYIKKYTETEYKSNSELPIDIAVNEYKKYAKWKENVRIERRNKARNRERS